MPHTLGFTGMDPATESALHAAFAAANTRVGGHWRLVPETDAEFVVVDMDSMYGPMSWLQLQSRGRRVIGVTSAPRTQTEFRLARPFDAASLAELLQSMDDGSSRGAEAPAAAAPASAGEASAVPAGMTPAPRPVDQLPEEQPHVAVEEAPVATEPLEVPAPGETTPVTHQPPSVAVGQVLPAAPSIAPHAPAPASAVAAPAPPAPAPVAPRTLADWLRPGRLLGRVRYEHGGARVLIDAEGQQYFGPAALKPLAPLFEGEPSADDFVRIDADWDREVAALGAGQPLQRLAWYGALLSGRGELAAGFDPQARYSLTKWPQTEREFPKHFRVATAMMKGPATLGEIAETSSVPLADVTDFVNASLATGFAEPYREPAPEPDSAKSSGLFGRLRGR